MAWLQDLLGTGAEAAVGAYDVNRQYQSLGDQQDYVNKTLWGGEENQPTNVARTAVQMGQLDPYGVKSGIGTTQYDPATGNTSMQLSNPMQGRSDQMFGWGQQALGQSMADPSARTDELYERMRQTQRPDEMRAQQSMNANMFSSGRGGMGTSAYGGTPEQLAYGKAIQESQDKAWLGAYGAANKELQDQYTRGLGMTSAAYDPYKMNLAQGEYGLNAGKLQQEADRGTAGMFGDFALGGLGTNLQYDKLRNDIISQGMQVLGPLAGSAGDQVGGWLERLFKTGQGGGDSIYGDWADINTNP